MIFTAAKKYKTPLCLDDELKSRREREEETIQELARRLFHAGHITVYRYPSFASGTDEYVAAIDLSKEDEEATC